MSADILIMHIWTGYSTAFTWQLRISSGRYTKYTPVSTFQNRVFISQFFLSCLLLLCCWFDSINILCFNVIRHKYLYLSLLIKIKTKNYQVTNLGRAPPPPSEINKLEYEISWLQCNTGTSISFMKQSQCK